MGLEQLNQHINFIHSQAGTSLSNDDANRLRKSLNQILGYTVASLNSLKNNSTIPEFTEKAKTGFDANTASIKECCKYMERVQDYIVFSEKQIEKIKIINTRFTNILKEAKSDPDKNYKDVTRIIKAMEKSGAALNNAATLFIDESVDALNKLEDSSSKIKKYLKEFNIVNFVRSVQLEDDTEEDDLQDELLEKLPYNNNVGICEVAANQALQASPKPTKAVSVFSTPRSRPLSRLEFTPGKNSNEAIMKKLDEIRTQLGLVSTKEDVQSLGERVELLANQTSLERVEQAVEQTKEAPVEMPQAASNSAIRKWFLLTALTTAIAGAGYVFYKKRSDQGSLI